MAPGDPLSLRGPARGEHARVPQQRGQGEPYMYVYVGIMWDTVFPRKDAAATIYFSATAMRRLFDDGTYSGVAFNSVTGTRV